MKAKTLILIVSLFLSKQLIAQPADIIIDDFQVNENVGGAAQTVPSMAADASGNFVMTWQDTRDGSPGVYAQRFASDGSPLGGNFKVNDVDSPVDRFGPKVAVAGNGDFTIAWFDRRLSPEGDVFVQRFDKSGMPIGENFAINPPDADASNFIEAAADKNGNTVVAWSDFRHGNNDVFMQRFDPNGNPSGDNIQVNENGGTANDGLPSVAFSDSGKFVVVWDANTGGDRDVFFQRFDTEGTPLGGNVLVNDNTGTTFQGVASVAMDSLGNFIVVWADNRRTGAGDIMAQRYAADGSAINSNFRVNDDTPANHSNPVSILENDGKFLVIWRDNRGAIDSFYGQRYGSDAMPVGVNFLIGDSQPQGAQLTADATANAAGYIFGLQDTRATDANIYLLRMDRQGNALENSMLVNDDPPGSSSQQKSRIAVDSSGNFVVAWQDDRNGNPDIYAQRFSNQGAANGSNILVNQNLEPRANQSNPDIASSATGHVIITWQEARPGGFRDILAQFFDVAGNPVDTNRVVNDSRAHFFRGVPVVAADRAGNSVIAWQDGRNIFLQRFDADRNPVGANFVAHDTSKQVFHTRPAVHTWDDSLLVIAWSDWRDGAPDVYARLFDAANQPLSGEFHVNEQTGALDRAADDTRPLAIAADDSFFTVTWTDHRNGIGEIFAQRYRRNGSQVGTNFKVSSAAGYEQKNPSISHNDAGDFVISWHGRRTVSLDIFARAFNSQSTPLGDDFQLNSRTSDLQFLPHVGLLGRRIFATWSDNSGEQTGFDVMANVTELPTPTSVQRGKAQSLPFDFALKQNHPNPFNPATTIDYTLPVASTIRLDIYDIQGNLVRRLVHETQTAGSHQEQWDGRDDSAHGVASGVYFYRLTIGSNDGQSRGHLVRKMLLMK